MNDTSQVDFAVVAVFLFFTFFVSLILYLRREDRREGYPLEDDGTGRVRVAGGMLFTANPKTFRLRMGRGEFTAPNGRRDRRELAAERTSVTPGSPLRPTGNPMVDGIGPASYAERAKVPDMTLHGDLKIVPMRVAPEFEIASSKVVLNGMKVVGADGASPGVVKDVWIDRAEVMIRYLEVELAADRQSVMLPLTMARINKKRGVVKVHAITGEQFAGVPKLENPDQITLYEEERVTAYFGGGFLYATPRRADPLL